MIPSPSQSLADIAVRIATHLMPATNSNYAQADSGLITGLLLAFAQDFERAIYNHMADLDEIKALCLQLRELPEDKREGLPPQADLDDFIAQTPRTLMFADVNALHARGLELLISIHCWAERNNPEMDLEVWRLLRRHSERNKFEIPGV